MHMVGSMLVCFTSVSSSHVLDEPQGTSEWSSKLLQFGSYHWSQCIPCGELHTYGTVQAIFGLQCAVQLA